MRDLPELPCAEADSLEWREHVRKHDIRLTALETKLDANSATTERVEKSTQGIVEMMESWNGAMKTITSVGNVLRPLTWIIGFCTAVVGLWATIWHDWGGR